jgi:CBS domain-containing protein
MTPQAYDYISRMPHFAMLPKPELERVATAATYKRLGRGVHFARQAETVIDSIFIISEGALTLFDERNGQKKLAGYIKPGEVFGGITILLNGGISLRSAQVEEACSGYQIPKDIFWDLCTRYSAFYEYFLENFSKNILDPSLSSIIQAGQARNFLGNIEPFSFLPDQDLSHLVDEMSIVRHTKGTVLFVQGSSRLGYLYIVQKGSAERYFEERNERTMKELLGEGDIYGGISILLNDGISVRTVRMLEDTFFYLLPKETFLAVCKDHETFSAFFTDAFGKRMLQRSYAAVISKTLQPREEGLQFFNRHVATVYTQEPIFGSPDMTIQQAAETMARQNISSLLLNTDEGKCVGLVTERDLTHRVTATGYDIQKPVSDVMSAPVRSIPEYALVSEALLAMVESNIRHLAVSDVNDGIVGILTNRDLLTARGQSPLFLIRSIKQAVSVQEIAESYKRLPDLIRSLISGGARADNVTRFITMVSDTILKRIIGFTLDEMGPPPAKFAFMILGSEGRREQTLKTDQDNAIVFEDVDSGREDELMAYFLAFGEKACTMLDTVGYAFCTGGVMAQNPKWCQPLSKWQSYFHKWIHAAQPQDLLEASIFFDFRLGYGDEALITELRAFLFDALKGWVGFLRHLTENALHFKPPLGFFRNFVVESKGEHRDKFDIKAAMTPIVDFARIYALQSQVDATNTLERLSHLRINETLSQDEYEEIEKAYSFLMQLRFVRQIAAVIEEKSKPDNYINPKKLTRIEQKMLKEIFVRIERFQGKLEVDFIGLV